MLDPIARTKPKGGLRICFGGPRRITLIAYSLLTPEAEGLSIAGLGEISVRVHPPRQHRETGKRNLYRGLGRLFHFLVSHVS